jgi:hypothetical protein
MRLEKSSIRSIALAALSAEGKTASQLEEERLERAIASEHAQIHTLLTMLGAEHDPKDLKFHRWVYAADLGPTFAIEGILLGIMDSLLVARYSPRSNWKNVDSLKDLARIFVDKTLQAERIGQFWGACKAYGLDKDDKAARLKAIYECHGWHVQSLSDLTIREIEKLTTSIYDGDIYGRWEVKDEMRVAQAA